MTDSDMTEMCLSVHVGDKAVVAGQCLIQTVSCWHQLPLIHVCLTKLSDFSSALFTAVICLRAKHAAHLCQKQWIDGRLIPKSYQNSSLTRDVTSLQIG